MFYYAVVDEKNLVHAVDESVHEIRSSSHWPMSGKYDVVGRILKRPVPNRLLVASDFKPAPDATIQLTKTVAVTGSPVEIVITAENLMEDLFLLVKKDQDTVDIFRIRKDAEFPKRHTIVENAPGRYAFVLYDPSGFIRQGQSLIVYDKEL